ncbi:putative monocarboxylate transporter [Tricladium varicosporioides]|nr:putative monocarboxylate transporter [Hymenoscyphus varicosporioides]
MSGQTSRTTLAGKGEDSNHDIVFTDFTETAKEKDQQSIPNNRFSSQDDIAEATVLEELPNVEIGISPAPDGGMTGWLVVLGAWCISFCSFGWINSVGTFQDYYESDLLRTYSASQIAWIPSLQVFFMFAMGPIVGKLYDTHGPRYLILGGSLMHVFGLMMASLSTSYYQVMLSQGVCSAIGVSAIFQPSLSSVGGWFDKKRGAAFGILSTGSSVGGVIFPIMVSRLIREINYPWAMRISAFVIFFLLVIANLTVKSRFPPDPKVITKDELAAPFREPVFILASLGIFFFTFGLFVPITYLVVEAVSHGMGSDIAHYLVAIFNAASLFGRMSSGILADKFGKYNTFVAVSYPAGIFVLTLWLKGSNNTTRIVFALLFGFFSGSYVSLIPALVAQVSPVKTIGYRTGLVFLVASVGGLTTGPISGQILAHGGGWTGVKIFSGVFCLVGTTFVLFARLYHTGPQLTILF